MEMQDALFQLLGLIGATVAIVGTTELVLLWHLKAFKHTLYWPVHLLMNAGISFFLLNFVHFSALNTLIFWFLPFLGFAYFAKFKIKGKSSVAFLMLAPALVIIALLIVFPFFFQMRLAFGNLNLFTVGQWLETGKLGWSGFENFARVMSNSEFWILLGRTVLWTVINIVFHVGFGLGLAMLLNRDIRFKGLYRTLLVIPWAMPQVVAVLAWRGEFHPQFGMINQILNYVGIAPVAWWSDPIPVFVSVCLVNIWLGIPFMMIVFLGGLGSIPQSYYEASSIDGASKWQQFKNITLPLLKPAVVPSVTLGIIWTFNNINVIYLMTGQDGGKEHADILVSALYKSAFTYSRFSYSAAFAVVLFAILFLTTYAWIKVTKGVDEEYAK